MGFIANGIDSAVNAVGGAVNTVLPGKVGDIAGGLLKGGGHIAAAPLTVPLNVGSDLVTGNPSKIFGDLTKPFGEAAGDFGGIAKSLGISLPDFGGVGGPAAAPDHSNVDSANSTLNAALQSRLNKQQQNADSVTSDASNFRKNLPGYQDSQISNATDTAKSSLTNDIANVKSDANSRGMFYSGTNTANQQAAQANESGKLAGNIQKINSDSNTLADQKDQNSFKAQSDVAGTQVQGAQFKAQQAQDTYSAALQQQQNQTSFYGNIAGGIASAAGLAAILAL